MESTRQHLAEAFEEAAGLIETRGWTQGTWSDFDGYCLMGAVRAATLTSVNGAYMRAVQVLTEQLGTYEIAQWNDAPERDEDDVYELLMRCAKELRNGS